MPSRADRRHGYTLVEILCVLAIIGLLLGIAVPVYLNSRARGRQTTCLSHLRHLGHAVALYTQDFDSAYPPITLVVINDANDPAPHSIPIWTDLLRPYLSGGLYPCPESEDISRGPRTTAMTGYALNSALNITTDVAQGVTVEGRAESEVVSSAWTVLIFDARTGIVAMACPDDPSYYDYFPSIIQLRGFVQVIDHEKSGARRHGNRANYAFLDGHVRSLAPAAFRYRCDGHHPCFSL